MTISNSACALQSISQAFVREGDDSLHNIGVSLPARQVDLLHQPLEGIEQLQPVQDIRHALKITVRPCRLYATKHAPCAHPSVVKQSACHSTNHRHSHSPVPPSCCSPFEWYTYNYAPLKISSPARPEEDSTCVETQRRLTYKRIPYPSCDFPVDSAGPSAAVSFSDFFRVRREVLWPES